MRCSDIRESRLSSAGTAGAAHYAAHKVRFLRKDRAAMTSRVFIPVVAGITVAAGCVYLMLNHRGNDSLQYHYVYDDQGRIAETIHTAGRHTTVRYEMDGPGPRIVKRLPDGAEMALTLDRFGRPAAMS